MQWFGHWPLVFDILSGVLGIFLGGLPVLGVCSCMLCLLRLLLGSLFCWISTWKQSSDILLLRLSWVLWFRDTDVLWRLPTASVLIVVRIICPCWWSSTLFFYFLSSSKTTSMPYFLIFWKGFLNKIHFWHTKIRDDCQMLLYTMLII